MAYSSADYQNIGAAPQAMGQDSLMDELCGVMNAMVMLEESMGILQGDLHPVSIAPPGPAPTPTLATVGPQTSDAVLRVREIRQRVLVVEEQVAGIRARLRV